MEFRCKICKEICVVKPKNIKEKDGKIEVHLCVYCPRCNKIEQVKEEMSNFIHL